MHREHAVTSLAPGEKPPPPPNYITPQGHARLQRELLHLLDVERPEVVRVVQWAASNGDRSENADYQYGKRRLRQIDRRIRFLTQRLDLAKVIDPLLQPNPDQVFFGATVDLIDANGEEQTVRIVGVDEIDPHRGWISWISPVARALLKAREGDEVQVHTPGGQQTLEVGAIRYESLEPVGDTPQEQ
ncbi:MAG: transcription elongation factor GreB [Betaproteobacteria bacterium]|nr:transcription elongation factor GreB [Betaproteobacteria bacterium]